MSNYEYPTFTYKELNRVELPKFQRALVWNKQKKMDLIETLHKDFPFGSLLVAPMKDSKSKLRLLDGQQRLSTMREYEKHKVDYWKKLNHLDYRNDLKQINDILDQFSGDKLSEKHFDVLLKKEEELGDWTDSYESLHIPVEDRKKMRTIVNETIAKIEGYIRLDDLRIPLIKFLGNDEDLPEIYENLNKGGTPLNKYEIYNAAWSNENLNIPSDFNLGDTILNNVKNFYKELQDHGEFVIENFSEDEISETRTINSAEFGRALGKMAVDAMPALFSRSSVKAINEIGFGILAISVNVKNKQLANVSKHKDEIQKKVSTILNQTESIANRLNECFDKILRQNISFSDKTHAKKSLYSVGLTTSFKVLSYFASLWDKKDSDIQKSITNIPAYYVFDALNGSWTAHGDQRLTDYYPDIAQKDYLKPLNQEDFITTGEQWIKENEGIRKTFSPEVKALITIHSNLTYFSGILYQAQDFEFEHIIPKARVLEHDPENNSVHLSNLGNGMFLPKSTNNAKNDKTFWEVEEDLYKGNFEQLVEGSHYWSKEELDNILSALKSHDFEGVNAKIDERAGSVLEDLAEKLII